MAYNRRIIIPEKGELIMLKQKYEEIYGKDEFDKENLINPNICPLDDIEKQELQEETKEELLESICNVIISNVHNKTNNTGREYLFNHGIDYIYDLLDGKSKKDLFLNYFKYIDIVSDLLLYDLNKGGK
ncbi:MAG: hypothetical protein ACOCRK_07040 [bacterium]